MIRIAHLYGNLLNTYGDAGNLLMLKHLCEKSGYETQTTIISLKDDFNPNDYDLVFFGGGQDTEQAVVSQDIQRLVEPLKQYIESNGVFVGICGGFQLLGHYYVNSKNEKIKGTSILDLYTENQITSRFIGDTIMVNDEFNETYYGFENHSGTTFLGENLKPLGRITLGNGNNGEDQTEGCHYKNVYCSYFHGPLLVRNQHLAQRIINEVIKKKINK